MNAIEAYRDRHKLTLDEVARRIRDTGRPCVSTITKSTIWKYENGIVPPVEVAIAISIATDFEVRVADLRPEVVAAVRAELERTSDPQVAA